MKKITSILLLILMIVSISGCHQKTEDETNSKRAITIANLGKSGFDVTISETGEIIIMPTQRSRDALAGINQYRESHSSNPLTFNDLSNFNSTPSGIEQFQETLEAMAFEANSNTPKLSTDDAADNIKATGNPYGSPTDPSNTYKEQAQQWADKYPKK